MHKSVLKRHRKGDAMNLKEKIEQLMSEILSDQHECKVTLNFEPKQEKEVA